MEPLKLSLIVLFFLTSCSQREVVSFDVSKWQIECVKYETRKKPDCISLINILNPISSAHAVVVSPAVTAATAAAASAAARRRREEEIKIMCSKEETAFEEVCVEFSVKEKK